MSKQSAVKGRNLLSVVALGGLLATAGGAQASIVFADFNSGVSTFGYTPGFSGTSSAVNKTPTDTSTATRSGPGGVDPSASDQYITLGWTNTTTSAGRIRWVSGGPPFNSTNAGNPAVNTAFTVTSGVTDGYIGFYARTSDTTLDGTTVSINLDQSANTTATMTGGVPKTLITDGAWHLYEWNLDSASDWGAVAGLGGAATNLDSASGVSHTIDSLYFQNIPASSTGAQHSIDVDFIAKSDSGSVATLVPEPGALSLLGLAGLALVSRRRRRSA